MVDLDPVAVVLLVSGALLVAYLLVVGVLHVIGPLRRVGGYAATGLAAPFTSVFYDMNRESRFGEIEAEVKRALGQDDDWGDQERTDIVTAALAAQEINVLNQNLRKAVRQCLQTHWAVAEGSGAIQMSEAARHPLSQKLRQRVMDTSDLLSHRLSTYPLIFDSPELIRLQLGLRWIPATCATCPYWTSTFENAPRVCPTAKAMTARTAAHPMVDAEVVDDCRD